MTPNPTFRRRQGGETVQRDWKQIALRVTKQMKDEITEQAIKANIPDVDYIRAAIAEKLERDKVEA